MPVAAHAGSSFRFLETFAVPYYATAIQSWVTHGTLATPLGLSADLMYGFAAPDAKSFILAGGVPGTVNSTYVGLGFWVLRLRNKGI